MSHTCINCNVRFQDADMQREHYKTVRNYLITLQRLTARTNKNVTLLGLASLQLEKKNS